MSPLARRHRKSPHLTERFELLIQALQAYLFTLLTAVYISGALHAEH